MRITKMQRHKDGYLVARLTLDGERTVPVHRKYGSWMRDYPGRPGWLLELPKQAVVALASKATTFENRERKGLAQLPDTEEVAA